LLRKGARCAPLALAAVGLAWLPARGGDGGGRVCFPVCVAGGLGCAVCGVQAGVNDARAAVTSCTRPYTHTDTPWLLPYGWRASREVSGQVEYGGFSTSCTVPQHSVCTFLILSFFQGIGGERRGRWFVRTVLACVWIGGRVPACLLAHSERCSSSRSHRALPRIGVCARVRVRELAFTGSLPRRQLGSSQARVDVFVSPPKHHRRHPIKSCACCLLHYTLQPSKLACWTRATVCVQAAALEKANHHHSHEPLSAGFPRHLLPCLPPRCDSISKPFVTALPHTPPAAAANKPWPRPAAAAAAAGRVGPTRPRRLAVVTQHTRVAWVNELE
jgi:hypothetical protein